MDLYDETTKRVARPWGGQNLKVGDHVLRFEGKGKSDKSTGFGLGLDSLAILACAYEKPPGFDLRKIQK